MLEQHTNEIIDQVLDPNAYRPLITGHIDELLVRLSEQQTLFPKMIGLFRKILEAYQSRHSALEDWLIIPIYGFIWSKETKRLGWIEDRFVELSKALGDEVWLAWIDEFILQTNCLTTHRVCDRIYDYLLHMYGALYLIRQGWSIHFLPMKEGGADIVGTRWDEKCLMECKFKHMSNKFESLFWRFDTACSRFSNKPLVVSAQFNFPNSERLKELSREHYLLLKEFVSKVYQNPDVSHKGAFANMKFHYDLAFPVASSIDSQSTKANASAMSFFQNSLSSVLNRAAEQLCDPKYKDHQRILFIGIQPDPLLSMPWTDSSLRELKLLFALKAHWEHNIAVVFSDEVGFSVAGYL